MKKITLNISKMTIEQIGNFVLKNVTKYDEINWIIKIDKEPNFNLKDILNKISNNEKTTINVELVEKMKFVAELFTGLGYKKSV